MTLSKLLEDYIKENNITGREFARRCGNGISYAYIANIIRGYSPSTGEPPKVSAKKMALIAKGMNVSYDQLLSMLDNRQSDTELTPNQRPPDQSFGQRVADLIESEVRTRVEERIKETEMNEKPVKRKWRILSAGSLKLSDEQLDKLYMIAHTLYPDDFPFEDMRGEEGDES